MNIYWPVYRNLESEFLNLMFNIHIDDNQLNVYSSKIADLILRAAVDIESISKELYWQNGGQKTGQIKYDDALNHLINKWLLDKKVVLISSVNCFQTNKTLFPFIKNEIKTGKSSKTYSWNNSYQNIKHDRRKSLEFGSIKYLFDILSVLFVLNLYYSDKTFPLDKDSQGIALSPNFGSDIFSINVSIGQGYEADGKYMKSKDFDKSIYYIKQTEESNKLFKNSMKSFNNKIMEIAMDYHKVMEYIAKGNLKKSTSNWLYDALGNEDYKNVLKQAYESSPIATNQLRYEARLNKNE